MRERESPLNQKRTLDSNRLCTVILDVLLGGKGVEDAFAARITLRGMPAVPGPPT